MMYWRLLVLGGSLRLVPNPLFKRDWLTPDNLIKTLDFFNYTLGNVMKEANCTFKVTSWDERPYQELEGGAKLTQAKVSQAYQGAISGDGLVEFLIAHAANGTASFVGMELVKGSVSGKSGSFVIQHVGTFDSGGARSDWSIVPNSGTGELSGIIGKGSYIAASEAVSVFFSYELPNNT